MFSLFARLLRFLRGRAQPNRIALFCPWCAMPFRETDRIRWIHHVAKVHSEAAALLLLEHGPKSGGLDP